MSTQLFNGNRRGTSTVIFDFLTCRERPGHLPSSTCSHAESPRVTARRLLDHSRHHAILQIKRHEGSDVIGLRAQHFPVERFQDLEESVRDAQFDELGQRALVRGQGGGDEPLDWERHTSVSEYALKLSLGRQREANDDGRWF